MYKQFSKEIDNNLSRYFEILNKIKGGLSKDFDIIELYNSYSSELLYNIFIIKEKDEQNDFTFEINIQLNVFNGKDNIKINEQEIVVELTYHDNIVEEIKKRYESLKDDENSYTYKYF